MQKKKKKTNGQLIGVSIAVCIICSCNQDMHAYGISLEFQIIRVNKHSSQNIIEQSR